MNPERISLAASRHWDTHKEGNSGIRERPHARLLDARGLQHVSLEEAARDEGDVVWTAMLPACLRERRRTAKRSCVLRSTEGEVSGEIVGDVQERGASELPVEHMDCSDMRRHTGRGKGTDAETRCA